MPTEDANSSGPLVLSHYGACMCFKVDTNLSGTSLDSGRLSSEHPAVLLFCFMCFQLVYLEKKGFAFNVFLMGISSNIMNFPSSK